MVWREETTLRGHEGGVLSCRFNSTGQYVISGGRDKSMRLWNPFRATQLAIYCEHGYEVRGCDASRDSSRLASCGGDRQVFFWDVATGKYIRKLRGHDAGGVNCVRFCGEKDALIASGGEDKKLHFWDLRSSAVEPVHSEDGGRDAVSDIQTLSSERVLVASVDGSVRCYDVRRGSCAVDDIGGPVTGISVSKDEALMLASCLSSQLALVDRETGTLLNTLEGHTNANSYKIMCSFVHGANDAFAVSGSDDGALVFWDVLNAAPANDVRPTSARGPSRRGNSCEHITNAHAGVITCVASHADERVLASSSSDGTVKLWRDTHT